MKLENIQNWLIQHDLTLSIEKCEAVWFTKGHRSHRLLEIKIQNMEIPLKNQTKFLGVIFHKNIKWNIHIDNVVYKARKNINILQALCRVWWGADPRTLLMIFNALVRSHLDYGSILVKPA